MAANMGPAQVCILHDRLFFFNELFALISHFFLLFDASGSQEWCPWTSSLSITWELGEKQNHKGSGQSWVVNKSSGDPVGAEVTTALGIKASLPPLQPVLHLICGGCVHAQVSSFQDSKDVIEENKLVPNKSKSPSFFFNAWKTRIHMYRFQNQTQDDCYSVEKAKQFEIKW